MEQQNKTKLIWFSILTIAVGTIVSFVLYFAGWVASITSFITMFVLILIYKKYCQNLPNKKTLIYELVAVNLSHVIAIVLSMFVTAAIFNNISIFDAISLISTSVVSYIVWLSITTILMIAMSLFGSLSAYQYYKNVFQQNNTIAKQSSKTEQQNNQEKEKQEEPQTAEEQQSEEIKQ